MLTTTVAILAAITAVIYCYFYHKHSYWTRKGVIQENPIPILGNYGKSLFLKKNMGQVTEALCENFPDAPVIGMYFGTRPGLIVKDPEYIKTVLFKDFYYFNSREAFGYNEAETGTKHIFNVEGDHWKVLRQNLAPLFSSGKMKNMFYLIQQRTEDLEKLINQQVETGKFDEMRLLMARYTMDCIGSCFFGIETNTMGDNKDNPFDKVRAVILNFNFYLAMKFMGRVLWPSFFYSLGLKLMPQDVVTFFQDMVNKVFSDRGNKPGTRNDFIDALLVLKNNKIIEGDKLSNMKKGQDNEGKIVKEVTNEMVAAQCMAFFTGGFETSSGTLSVTLFELAKNKHVQRRLQNEIDEYLKTRNGKVEYDCVSELPYLDACVNETLRLYPVLGILMRQAVEDYTFENGVTIEKGANVFVPCFYLHKVPEYFPKPNEYIPERFLPENRGNIKPYTFFPFGDGPRMCIGTRFAKMQVYAGLVTMLKSFNVELAESMPRDLVIDTRIFLTIPRNGVYLKFVPRVK